MVSLLSKPITPYLACALAATLIVCSFAPFNYWVLAILGLMLFYKAIAHASFKQTLARSFFFGLILYLAGTHWVWVSMHIHGGASKGLATFMTLGFCVILSFFLILPFGGLFYFLKQTPIGRTLGFAACWFLHEWTSTWIFTGFPWLLIGYSQTESLFRGLAPIIGTLGISFMIALTSAVICNAKQDIKRQSYQTLLMILGVAWLFSPFFHDVEWTQKQSVKPLSVALVQPNYTLEQKWDYDMTFPIREYYKSTLDTYKDTDILLWPESAFTEIYQDVPNFIEQLDETAKAYDTALIFGMPTGWLKDDRVIYWNSIHAKGEGSGMYHKQKLVPFGEYVPLEETLRGLIQFFDLPMSDFSKGPSNQAPLMAKGIVVTPYICYELVYPDFVTATAKDSNLLLTVSNDTWFGRSIGPKQHMQMAQMRALETGRYLIRSTNDGITAVVNPQGEITDVLPQFERGVLESEVYAMKGFTPVSHYGTLPFLIFSLIIVALTFRKHSPK